MHHAVPDSMLAVIRCHTHMVEKAGPSVVSAEDGTYNAAVLLCHHAGGWIALQKPRHAFPGIVDGTDSEALNAHPEFINFIIIFRGHLPDQNAHGSCHVMLPFPVLPVSFCLLSFRLLFPVVFSTVSVCCSHFHVPFGGKNKQKQQFILLVYGNTGICFSPVFSGSPNNRFMFCMACPAAPFTILSIAPIITTRLVLGSSL